MQVVWSKAALDDLVKIRTYIAQDNPAAARQTAERILESIKSILAFPGIGRAGRLPGTRELVINQTSYLLPYQVKDDNLIILRVLHTSRKWPL